MRFPYFLLLVSMRNRHSLFISQYYAAVIVFIAVVVGVAVVVGETMIWKRPPLAVRVCRTCLDEEMIPPMVGKIATDDEFLVLEWYKKLLIRIEACYFIVFQRMEGSAGRKSWTNCQTNELWVHHCKRPSIAVFVKPFLQASLILFVGV